MPDALRLAVGTLTALPVPPPGRVDRRTAARAMVLAPVAALLLLLVPAAVIAGTRALDLSPAIAATLTVIALALGTRAFHLDGLTDTADGLTASYDRERALQVMRTGDVGPAGAATLVLVLALQITCGATLLTDPAGMTLATCAVVISRLALTWACVRGVPSARPAGLGAMVAGAVSRRTAALSTLVVGLLLAGGRLLAGLAWWSVPVLLVSALVATVSLLLRCTQRLGGLTGDVLGAVVEITCATTLLAAAALH